MTVPRLSVGLFALFVMVGSVLLLAQTTTGTISGTIQDETGAVLPGVTVTIKNTDTGATRTALSDDQGRYLAPNLAVGPYEIRAELPGFKTVTRRGVVLTVGREAVVTLTMSIGEITEQVTVTSEAPQVDTSSSAISGLVTGQQITDLPLNGRDYLRLAALQMGTYAMVGVVSNDPTNRQSRSLGLRLSVGGASDKANQYLMDGTTISETSGGSPGGISGNNFGVDAIREFQVLTNAYSAEYGGHMGGVVSVVTRSGTNDFHGTAFLFHRNDNLDARKFFDEEAPPEFKRNQFGFTGSGPIVRDRTFFVGGYEGFRERLGVTTISGVPTAEAKAGSLTGGVVSPIARPYLNLYPLPNGLIFPDGTGEFVNAVSRPTDEDFFMAKVDHNFTSKHSFFGRYTFTDGDFIDPDGFNLSQRTLTNRSQYATLEQKSIFSPTLLNTFRFGFTRADSFFFTEQLFDIDPAFLFNPGNITGGLGVIEVPGLANLVGGGGDVNPRRFAMNTFDYNDTLTYTRGPHVIKTGVKVLRGQFNNLQSNRPGARVRFSTVADLVLARPREAEGALPGSDGFRSWRQTQFALFFQDDFKWKPNFTWNLGVRYEFSTNPTEENDKGSNLINPLTDTKMTLVEHLFDDTAKTLFAPRIGLAWDPFSDGKTSVRSGFGIFYDVIWIHHYLQEGALNNPFMVIGSRLNPPFPQVYQGFTKDDLPITLQRLNAIESDAKTPYRIQYNLNIQREIVPTLVVQAAYVGSRTVHALMAIDAENNGLPQILPDGRKFFPPGLSRRNPALGPVRNKRFQDEAWYNSLQLGVTKHLSQGISFQANYTWSKNLDLLSNFFNTNDFNNSDDLPDPDDPQSNKGPANFDVRNYFVLNYTIELPLGKGRRWGSDWSGAIDKVLGGWELSGIVTAADGVHFSPVIGFDRARAIPFRRGGDQRPDLAPGATNDPVIGDPIRWFDTGNFTVPVDARGRPVADGFFGNLGRNTVSAPGIVTWDFSLTKNTPITESVKLQFRTEIFNILNRANFGLPEREVFTSRGPVARAGRITDTTTTARQIQFGLKLVF